MTTQEKIAKIIEEEFRGYRGHRPLIWGIKQLHTKIRRMEGDEKFLALLEKTIKENPKPVYKP